MKVSIMSDFSFEILIYNTKIENFSSKLEFHGRKLIFFSKISNFAVFLVNICCTGTKYWYCQYLGCTGTDLVLYWIFFLVLVLIGKFWYWLIYTFHLKFKTHNIIDESVHWYWYWFFQSTDHFWYWCTGTGTGPIFKYWLCTGTDHASTESISTSTNKIKTAKFLHTNCRPRCFLKDVRYFFLKL